MSTLRQGTAMLGRGAREEKSLVLENQAKLGMETNTEILALGH